MDSPITREGEAAIDAMAARLASIPFDCCYTSDLMRARKTAEGLLKFRAVPIIEEEALRELPSIIKWVKLLSDKGKIVVIITHDSLLAEATSDKFLYLEEGKQIKEGKKVLYEYN